jgi:hypothetical protein
VLDKTGNSHSCADEDFGPLRCDAVFSEEVAGFVFGVVQEDLDCPKNGFSWLLRNVAVYMTSYSIWNVRGARKYSSDDSAMLGQFLKRCVFLYYN